MTTQIEVNVDSFAYHGRAPREGAARPLLFAGQGDVVTLEDDEAERARALLVGKVYADPLGGGGSVRRLEPAAIDVGAQSATGDELTAWNAKRAELRAELARLEANAPLVARAPAEPMTARSTVDAPLLPPSVTGVRQVAPMGSDVATAGAGTPTSIDLNTASAAQVVAHLNQYPGQIDAIAAAEEERRGGPRKAVTEVIATHRRVAEERRTDGGS